MRVLVACEFSGVVRDAFSERGHTAVSCDLLPTERPGFHHQGDVLELLDRGYWDLLIAHPPCTYLANSGVRWLWQNGGAGPGHDEARMAAMREAAEFFAKLLTAPIPRIAVENPVMHHYGRDHILHTAADIAGWVDVKIRTIHPWQFGHGETKATQLWLRNLPPLVPTDIVEGRTPRVHYASPGPDRWKERSRTLPGIAAAMADQWGALPIEAAA